MAVTSSWAMMYAGDWMTGYARYPRYEGVDVISLLADKERELESLKYQLEEKKVAKAKYVQNLIAYYYQQPGTSR